MVGASVQVITRRCSAMYAMSEAAVSILESEITFPSRASASPRSASVVSELRDAVLFPLSLPPALFPLSLATSLSIR